MASENDRIARAGDYILGLMSDRERERAERDLEVDPAFRDAVVRLAERMHIFDRAGTPDDSAEDRWKLITQRIAELPQMRPASLDGGETERPVIRTLARPPHGTGLHALGGRRGMLIALGLAVAFALGYAAGSVTTIITLP